MDNQQKKIEITRSFGRTIQPQEYKPVKFFCSAKAEVSKKEIERVSKELYELCKEEVNKSVAQYEFECPGETPKTEPSVKWIGEEGKKEPVSKSDVEEEEIKRSHLEEDEKLPTVEQ